MQSTGSTILGLQGAGGAGCWVLGVQSTGSTMLGLQVAGGAVLGVQGAGSTISLATHKMTPPTMDGWDKDCE